MILKIFIVRALWVKGLSVAKELLLFPIKFLISGIIRTIALIIEPTFCCSCYGCCCCCRCCCSCFFVAVAVFALAVVLITDDIAVVLITDDIVVVDVAIAVAVAVALFLMKLLFF
jgi:hypothetical protein